MGTKTAETQELQNQIKELVAKLGWSQNRLAREIYVELNEVDDDREIGRFQERLKKDLSRKTTKPQRLEEYINVILRHVDAEKLDIVKNRYVPLGFLSSSLTSGLAKISAEIDEKFK